MKKSSIARKYAKVFMRMAHGDKDLEKLETDLSRLARILENAPAIEKFFLSPVMSKQRKTKVFEQLCSKAGISEPVRSFLSILLENERFDLISDLREAMQGLKDERMNIVAIEVTTAMQIDSKTIGKLQSLFSSVTGKNIRLSMKVDPSIIGGVVAKVGSTIYDGGISTHLMRMKEKILGE